MTESTTRRFLSSIRDRALLKPYMLVTYICEKATVKGITAGRSDCWAAAPLEMACPHAAESRNERKNGLRAGRLQNLAARARSEDERPAYLGKRASRSFPLLRSTTETVVFRFSSLVT